MSTINAPPPFLVKTYDMVDDPDTDKVLPLRAMKIASSSRTLLSSGFRKVYPDGWEFANKGFLRGQKHLLKTILELDYLF